MSDSKNNNKETSLPTSNPTNDLLDPSLLKNITAIKKAVGNSTDIIIREVVIGKTVKQPIAIIYIEGLADKTAITDFIMESLMFELDETLESKSKKIIMESPMLEIDEKLESKSKEMSQYLKNYCLTVGDVKDVSNFTALYSSIFNGETVILLDGETKCIATSTKSSKDRAITEPSTESVIRGPRESFTETLGTNKALIRRKIKNPNLWITSRVIGTVTQTDVAVMHINGIANDDIVKEVLDRLDSIDIDGILESGYIEDLIHDSEYSIFPTVYNSERPDVIAAELLEGKVAILVDGTPYVLIVPALFTSFIQSAEDYYQNAVVSSLIRLLRFLGLMISLTAPSLYISITTFHQEMLPTPMLISLASQREGVPFPAVFEALLMEIAFEVLREAGLRMPRMIGPAISIVGTLVIGQAAVEAGIVSAVMVIIVSLTAICSFLFPAYGLSNTIRVLRFPLMILSAGFGLYGLMIGVMVIILHLCSLRSFGIPYMSPYAPFILKDQKDALFLFPRRFLSTRPRLVSQKNNVRGHKPSMDKKRIGQ